MRCLTVSLAAVTCGLIATTASAQWVNFSNQTATRLLTPAPSSSAVGSADVDEKDYAYADVDLDGDIDLVAVRKQPFTSTGRRRNVLFMNEGIKEGHAINGVLVDRTSTLIPAFLDLTNDRDVVLVDVNGDGWLDIVTATTLSGDQPKSISHPRIYINRGNDAGGNWLGYVFDDVNRIPTFPVEPRFCAVSAGDIDGDGDMDLYFTDYQQGPYQRPSDLNDRLLLNDGNGYFGDTFTTRMTFEMLDSAFGMASAIADMNGDGFLDIVKDTALVPPQRISVSYNNPANQGFFNQFQVVQPVGAPYHVSVGDLNNDGRLDIINSDDGADRYYLNQGNGTNGQVNWISFTYSFIGGGSDDGFGGDNYIRDLNNDGWNDVIIADVDVDISGCNRRTHIYRNLGNAPNVTLQEQIVGGQVVGGITPAMLTGTHDIAIFDINGDGWKDMVIGRCTGTQVWINVPPAGLVFSYPQGLPGANIEPSSPYTFTVQLATVGGGTVVAGSGQMRLSINNGPFNLVAMTSLGGNLYQATLPAGSCTDKYAFYFSGQLQGGGTFNDPPTAPAASYITVLANGTETTVDQDFEGKVTGWTVVNDPSLTGGGWVRVDPNGTINAGQLAAPEDDFGALVTETQCFVTENGAPGGSANLSDVDFGPTYLTSPTIDLNGTDGVVTYARWFYCSGQGTSQGDFLHVEVSNNNGASWVPVHQIAGTNSAWEVASFLVSDFVAPSAQVRVRFWTSDPLNNSVTEAGIDNFRVDALICGSTPCAADLNGDGSVGPGDLGVLLGSWGNNPGSVADLNGDGSVGPADLGILLGSWGPC